MRWAAPSVRIMPVRPDDPAEPEPHDHHPSPRQEPAKEGQKPEQDDPFLPLALMRG